MSKFSLKYFYFAECLLILWFFFSPNHIASANLAKVSEFGPISVAISGNLIFIAELGGVVRLFDMEKKDIVAKAQIADSVQNHGLFHINGRIIDVVNYPQAASLFEVTNDGSVISVGTINGQFIGFDNEYFYYISYNQDNGKMRYKAYRVDNKLNSQQEGHIPGHPELTIHNQTEDSVNYWFFCTLTNDFNDCPKRGFCLISKSKSTNEMGVFRFPEDIDWKHIEIENDRDSVWILLDHCKSSKNRLIHFSKQDKIFEVTPYLGADNIIQNVDSIKQQPLTYVVHQSHQVFPMSHDSVKQKKTIAAQLLFIQRNYRLIPNPSGSWVPKDKYGFAVDCSRGEISQNGIKHAISDYAYIRKGFCYSGNLWFIAIRDYKDKANILYDIVKIPLNDGPVEVFHVLPTSGEKMRAVVKNTHNFFELIGIILFGD